MPAIAELGLAHGKSMAAVEDPQRLRIDNNGLFGDRSHMWVEAEPHTNTLYHKGEVAGPGHFLSQREDPVLTQIVPTATPDGLFLRTRDDEDGNAVYFVPKATDVADNRIPVNVWSWNGEGVDQGDEAAAWGKDRIGRPVRLVALSDEKPRWVEGDPKLGRVGFSDGYPITVASTDSLDAINEVLVASEHPPITLKRARANMLLSGLVLPKHIEPLPGIFPEDYVEKIKIGSGGLTAVLRRIKACSRCPIPDTDQVTGERKGRSLTQALGKLGRAGWHMDARYSDDRKLFWTQNFIIELPDGMPPDATIDITKDAKVEVIYSDTTNWTPKKPALAA